VSIKFRVKLTYIRRKQARGES